MDKYNEEFKIKLVTEYLNGNLGYKLLAKKYNMGSQTPIVEWVKVYKSQGMEGLKRRKTKKEYSVQFKLDTIIKVCHVKQPAQTTLRWKISLAF